MPCCKRIAQGASLASMARRGPPSVYSADIAEEVLTRLAGGESLSSISRSSGMPKLGTIALGAIVCHERFWASGGSRRQIDGHGGTGERSEDEEGSEPRRKTGLQLVASACPRGHRHLGRLPRATPPPDRGAWSASQRMVPASEEVKSPQQNGRMPPGSGDALPDGAAI